MAKTAKKRNPQDLTLRNLRALHKRIGALEDEVALLYGEVELLSDKVMAFTFSPPVPTTGRSRRSPHRRRSR